MELTVRLPSPHQRQIDFIRSQAKRKIIRAGRRGGKTVGMAILAVEKFLDKRRVLYGAPTDDQVEAFWYECKHALEEPIDAGILYKNETKHLIELPGTKFRIRAKTCWNAETIRGDYADLLILDEWQLMNEDTWKLVGAPMLLDNNGDAVFVYTPPSRKAVGMTKAKDPFHAAKMFKAAQADKSGRWAAFHFGSKENPHLDVAALAEIAKDMTIEAFRAEIEALDVEDPPGALWKRGDIDYVSEFPRLSMIAIGVDPHGGATECGIVAVGLSVINREQHIYVLADESTAADEATWGMAVVGLYNKLKANVIVAESNFGGTMVERVIRTVPGGDRVVVKLVSASRGKDVRAEPVVAIYQQKRGHHIGRFVALEDEMCQWVPRSGMPSPNRLDALVWGATEVTKGCRGGRGT